MSHLPWRHIEPIEIYNLTYLRHSESPLSAAMWIAVWPLGCIMTLTSARLAGWAWRRAFMWPTSPPPPARTALWTTAWHEDSHHDHDGQGGDDWDHLTLRKKMYAPGRFHHCKHPPWLLHGPKAEKCVFCILLPHIYHLSEHHLHFGAAAGFKKIKRDNLWKWNGIYFVSVNYTLRRYAKVDFFCQIESL